MNNKMNIVIVTNNNKFSSVMKEHLNDFARRNADRYGFRVADISEMNRNRVVFIVADKFNYIKSSVIKRLAFASYRPNGNIQTYVYTEDLGFRPRLVRDYSDVTKIEHDLNDERIIQHIDVELAEYRQLASMYYNSDVVRTRFSGMMKDFDNVLLCMRAEISESGFDFYSAGNPVTVEKMSNFTAREDSEFLYSGQTTSHPELRTKVQYQELALDTIRNWVQLQYYKQFEFEPDFKNDDDELFADVNPDWYSDGNIFG